MNTNKLAHLIWQTVAMDMPNKIKASTQKKIQDVLDKKLASIKCNCGETDCIHICGKCLDEHTAKGS